jgi:3,5-epimerase/4-reductase
MSLKILFYGSKGWIGGMFVQYFKEKYPNFTIIESSTRVQPGNEEKLKKEISEADRVICTIGRTSGVLSDGTKINTIDYLEKEGKLVENVQDNLYSPIMLAILCQQLNKHLLYLGTGCIFSWNTYIDQSIKIKENDYPNFFGSSYSTVKGFTDNLTRLFSDNVCNCRIRMPIVNYDHSRNFITKIVNYSKIKDMPNSMTYLPEMIPIMVEMSVTKSVGTFNMTNPGYITHSEILSDYKKFVNSNHTYELVQNEADLNLSSKRSNNILDTTKLEDWCLKHNLKLRSIQDVIAECFKNYNNY